MNELVPILDAAFKGRATKPSACIESKSEDYLLINDDVSKKTCVFVAPEGLTFDEVSQQYFSVQNPAFREIHLWAIDGCFMGQI